MSRATRIAAGWLPQRRNGAGSTYSSTMRVPPSMSPTRPISTRFSAEDFHRLFGVNTIGPFQMVRAARPLLEAAARAAGYPSSVVNVSSVAALNGTGSSIAYVASKSALNTMTLSLARALAPLIRVNALCPGYMDTPWWTRGVGQEGADKLREAVRAAVPLRVASKPEDTAEVVVFLAGPASRHVTGTIIPADAGQLLLVPVAPSDARR